MNKEELNWNIEPWNTIHAISILAISILALIQENLSFLGYFGLITFTVFVLLNYKSLKNLRPFAGYANWATGIRLIAFLLFLICLVDVNNTILWLVVLNGILILDIFDGYLARKFNHATKFGQFFDMEVDAFWVCCMCLLYYIKFDIPWWILLPGFLRYLYKLFLYLVPKPNFQESRKKYAAYIAGTFFVILSSSILLNGIFLEIVLGLGSFLICASFAVSTVEYLRY